MSDLVFYVLPEPDSPEMTMDWLPIPRKKIALNALWATCQMCAGSERGSDSVKYLFRSVSALYGMS